MTKNPFINSLLAMIYIVLISVLFYYGLRFADRVTGLIVPMMMLSLFTLSAAVMGMIFFYQPVCMYLDNDKASSVKLLGKTIGIFASITALVVISLFLVSVMI